MAKKIVGTAVATLGSLFLLFSYGLGLFGFLWPQIMANFMADLNLPRSSAMYQEMVYHRNPNAQNMYLALDRLIIAGQHNRVIEFSRKFFEHDDHQEVIDQVNKIMAENAFPHEIPHVANTRNRLRVQHPLSMLATGQEPSTAFLTRVFNESPMDLQQPCFVFFFLGIQLQDQVREAFRLYVREFVDVRFAGARPNMTERERLVPQHFQDMTRAFWDREYANYVGG